MLGLPGLPRLAALPGLPRPSGLPGLFKVRGGAGPSPWVELLRLPALFTVPGDALAGAAAAGAPPNRRTLLAIASSLCLYEAGMALNDWADREEDAVDRPHRPLPSGRIRPPAALAAAGGLTVAGLGLACSAGRRPFAVAGALAATVWSYDLILKRTPAGPLAMATARALDLLLGAAATNGDTRKAAPSALTLGTHTLAVTTVSRHETQGGSPWAPLTALATTTALAWTVICAEKPGDPTDPLTAQPGAPAAMPALRPGAPAATPAHRWRLRSAMPTHWWGLRSARPAHRPGARGALPTSLPWAGAAVPTTGTETHTSTPVRGAAATYASTLPSGATNQASISVPPTHPSSAALPTYTPPPISGSHTAHRTSGPGARATPLTSGSETQASPWVSVPRHLLTPRRTATSPSEAALRGALAAVYAVTAARPLFHAALNPSPQLTQRAVGGGIRAMIPLQAALAARSGAPLTALLTAALAPAARRFSRKVSLT
ncbi:SCO3242 family prenyltransferase [Streptomyces sp. NPDC050704]|uniref:SCO3242 family prenyltransferase n=1 Tax=Streptomyces sp. NPDC050704 TaxID=3157219 RepID=UPI00342605A4